MSGHAHHQGNDFTRAFAVGIALNVAIVVIELVFGLLGNSMALISDAGHNLSDVLGLVVGWAGAVMAKRSPSPRFTYGFKKASILAALINALFLLVAVGAIAAEAVRRLLHPAPAEAQAMIWVAAVAIVGNLLTAMLFARGRAHDLNVRAAFTHMAADAAVSAAVVLAGLRDPVDRAAMGRSGDGARGGRRHPVGQHRPVEGVDRNVADGRARGDRARAGRGRAWPARRASRPSTTFTSGR